VVVDVVARPTAISESSVVEVVHQATAADLVDLQPLLTVAVSVAHLLRLLMVELLLTVVAMAAEAMATQVAAVASPLGGKLLLNASLFLS